MQAEEAGITEIVPFAKRDRDSEWRVIPKKPPRRERRTAMRKVKMVLNLCILMVVSIKIGRAHV